jgi:hypothetical protein
MSDFTTCPYRSQGQNGDIVCNLAASIIKSSDNSLCVINDTVCQACYETNEIPNEKKINTIVARVLQVAAGQIIKRNEPPDEVQRANDLLQYIKDQLPEKCNCGNKRKTIIRKIGKIR